MEGHPLGVSCDIDETCTSLEEDCCPFTKEDESGYFSGIQPSIQSELQDKSFDPSKELGSYLDFSSREPQTTSVPESPGISQPLQKLQLTQKQFSDRRYQEGQDPEIKGLREPERSALHAALWQSQSERAAALIQNCNREALNVPNSRLQTPLHVAALQRLVGIVGLLVQCGADLRQVDQTGDTALHIVCREGYIEILQEVLTIADKTSVLQCLEARDYNGHTCLHLAALFLHLDIIKLLAEVGANVNAKDGTYNYTILHYAVQKRDLKLLECALSLERISLEETSYSGETALHLAEKLKYSDVIKCLRKRSQYQ